MNSIIDPNIYEKDAIQEVIHWSKSVEKIDIISRALRVASRPVLDYLENKIPSQLMEGFEILLAESIQKCFQISNLTTSKQLIFHRLRKIGIKVEDLNQLRMCNLKPLDEVAKTFFTEHAILAALEGASCGLGGITFAMADLPILVTLNFRVILQIALTFGFSVEDNPSRLFALKVLTMGLLDEQNQAHCEQWNQLNQLSKRHVHQQSEKSVACIGKDRLFLGTVHKLVSRLGLALSRRKIFAFMPLAGGAINAGINYYCTNRCSKIAFYIYRHKLLASRGYDLSESGMVL
ncbi:EcsC family protein [Candidatus Riflebacteria bacterium]